MCRLILPLVVFVLLASNTSALDITSIQPATTSPGGSVLLTGGPFTEQTLVIIGENELVPTRQSTSQIQVVIPDTFEMGDYVIYMAEGDQTSQQSFILHLVEPRPTITELLPKTIEFCQPNGSAPVMTVEGAGFVRGANALVDGAAVQLTSASNTHLEFELPMLEPGAHRVEIINPSGAQSTPRQFVVNSRPEILQITAGNDQVNSYQLVISGSNFHPKLQLTVDGRPIPQTGLYKPPGNDIFEFVDCSTLIYTRYSATGQLRRVSIRILNPGGQQSADYDITIR